MVVAQRGLDPLTGFAHHGRVPRPLRVTALVLLLVAGCGRDARPVEARPIPSGPPAPWSTMGFEARKAHMTTRVLPRMTRLFQAYDAKRFARVTCETCHGAGAEQRAYRMPNPGLLPLYPSGHPEQLELVRRQPETVRFMFNRVVPEIQALLGAEPYDPTTGTGLSCFACHPRGE